MDGRIAPCLANVDASHAEEGAGWWPGLPPASVGLLFASCKQASGLVLDQYSPPLKLGVALNL